MTEAASVKNEAKPLPRVSPATDILEREDGFYVYMDIPGVRREDLKIDINENELLVTGRAMQGAAEKETFLEVQFGPGEYVRAVALSDLVDRIDYVLLSPEWRVQRYAALTDSVGARFPSDHLPVVVRVSLD